MANQLVKFDQAQLATLNKVASECSLAIREAGNNISGALAVAEAMHQLRQLITPQMLTAVAALQNTAIGYMTDRGSNKGKDGQALTYSPDELRDPFIEATVRGFRAVGNEFNIISGRFYGAKAGFERKVRTFPGLSDFSAIYDVEEIANGTAKVQCIATWTMHGEPDGFERRKGKIKGQTFDNRIAVRVNAGMGHDAVVGKAQRKFYAAIYDYLIGAETATPEGDVDEPPVVQDGGKRVNRSSLFDEASGKEERGPDESGQAALVAGYRAKLATISAKSDVSTVAREAGKDGALTASGRGQVMALCSEATKVWPQRIAAGETNGTNGATSPQTEAPRTREPGEDDEPPFNPPSAAEQAAAHKSIDAQDAADMLAGWCDSVKQCNAVLDVQALEDRANELPESVRARFVEFCLERKTAIRGQRGGRR
jgi:hypothetical protein